MEKLRAIYEEINNISPIRFAVRVELKTPVLIENLKANIDKYSSIYPYITHEVSIRYSENVEADLLEAIVNSNNKIDIFICGVKTGVVFDHSIADAKTAITFCFNILRENCPVSAKDSINNLTRVFPKKYRGLSGWACTLKAVIIQGFTSLIHGKTKHSKHHRTNGDDNELNIVTAKLNKTATDVLIKKSKDSSSSISSLLLSAQIKASQEVLFEGKNVAIGVTTAVDLRQRCIVKPQYCFLSLCVSFVTVVVKVKKGEPFSEIIKNVKNKLSYKIKTGAHFTLYKMLPSKRFITQSIVGFFLSLNEKSSLQTNIGRIDDFYKLSIDPYNSVDFFVPPGVNQPFSISASTFKGELSISIVSFDTHLNPKLAYCILESIISSLKVV